LSHGSKFCLILQYQEINNAQFAGEMSLAHIISWLGVDTLERTF